MPRLDGTGPEGRGPGTGRGRGRCAKGADAGGQPAGGRRNRPPDTDSRPPRRGRRPGWRRIFGPEEG